MVSVDNLTDLVTNNLTNFGNARQLVIINLTTSKLYRRDVRCKTFLIVTISVRPLAHCPQSVGNNCFFPFDRRIFFLYRASYLRLYRAAGRITISFIASRNVLTAIVIYFLMPLPRLIIYDLTF